MQTQELKDRVLDRATGQGVLEVLRLCGADPEPAGREWKVVCPFHNDTKPSLTVNVTKKPRGGILACFACGWRGDVISFAQESQGIAEFRDAVRWLADRLGIEHAGRGVRTAGGTGAVLAAPRPVARSAPVPFMSAGEVYDALEECKGQKLDPLPWLERLYPGRAREAALALELVDGCVAKRPSGRTVLCLPQRKPLGELGAENYGKDGWALCSLRFRDFESKKRYSLDRKGKGENGELEQVACTEAGVMAPLWQFEAEADPFTQSVVEEGETDLLAGVMMMLAYGGRGDEHLWPCRWWGIPGVGNCHDMLLRRWLGPSAVCLLDPDAAGQRFMFDRRRRLIDRETRQDAGPDWRQDRVRGLIGKLRDRGVEAVGAFPPAAEGTKVDVRDILNAGWGWARLEEHILSTARGVLR